MLKQVSESIAAPAPPPATKFACESCENPPLIAMVAIPAAPLVAVIVTPDDPLKSRVEILPPVLL